MDYVLANDTDIDDLVTLRIKAMQPSLEAAGRFNVDRVKERFTDKFKANCTYKLIIDEKLIGFYVLLVKEDHYWLDHLYIEPSFQGQGLGKKVIDHIKTMVHDDKVLRLTALKESRANKFYQQQGFFQVDQLEWDYVYEWQNL